ncbi:MAG: dihydrodipicolinate reductase [Planctomycetota bacterium]
MRDAVRVVSVGLGPIGLMAAKLLLSKASLELVGAVDVDESMVGRDLAELLERQDPTGLLVESDLEAALDRLRPDAILHCTQSFLPAVHEQLLACVRRGVHVVSSAEELLVPDHQHPALADELDAAALEGGATVLGTGVNPGFAMDFLAVVCSAVASDVTSARCVRVVDAATRREPLQRKIGAGLSKSEFHKQLDTGRFGHIGMRESVAMVARGLGFEVDRIEHSVEPVFAAEDHKTAFLVVKEGAVSGIRNKGFGYIGKRAVVKLELAMYVGAPDSHDLIELEGAMPLQLRVPNGIPGDEATAAMLVNSLQGVVAAAPGLCTMLDLPAPRLAR